MNALSTDPASAVNHDSRHFLSDYFDAQFRRFTDENRRPVPNDAAEELELRLIEAWHLIRTAGELVGELPGANAGEADRIRSVLNGGLAILGAAGPAIGIIREALFRAGATMK